SCVFGSGAERFDADVLNGDRHRWASVDLQGENAGRESLGVGQISDIDRRYAIDEMVQVIAPGDDDVVVPIVGFEDGFNLFGRGNATGDFFFAVGVPNDFLSRHGHDAAATGAAGFVVKDA